MRLIDADALRENWLSLVGHDYEPSSFVRSIDDAPTVEPTLYGYPIEHLVMIARVMAKEKCTPEMVVQMLQNAGEIAKMVRDEILEMLEESIGRTCKGEANEREQIQMDN